MNEKGEWVSMERRIERLERQNVRMRLVGSCVLVLLIAMSVPSVLANMGGGEDSSVVEEGRFKSVVTNEFRLEDERGKLRASMGIAYENHGGGQPVNLVLYGEDEESGVELSSGGRSGPGVDIMWNRNGRARLGMTGGDPVLQIVDEKGKSWAVLSFMNGSPHLVLTDELGKSRAVFGYDDAWPGQAKPSTMALYDGRGNVVWSATKAKGGAR